MALSGPLAEAEAHVNKDKTLAASLASATAAATAQVESSANQAEKIQKESAEEATKAQFDMNLGLQELDMGLKFGEQQYARCQVRRQQCNGCPVCTEESR